MRDERGLVSDLFTLSSFEWNNALAEEFNFDFSAFVSAMNEYNYSNPCESTIHSKISRAELLTLEDVVGEPTEKKNDDITSISSIISTIRRNITALEISAEYGFTFRSFLVFGLVFDSLDLAGVVFDGCVFSNCTFINCYFNNALITGSKFIECQFENCDISSSTINKTGLFGLSFIDCNLEDVKYCDCVQHIVSYHGCELDESSILSGSLHRVDLDSCSMKKVNILNVILSAVRWLNSNFRSGQLVNSRLVGCAFDMIHTDLASQYANTFVGCDISTDLIPFFSEGMDEDSDESTEDSTENDSGDEPFREKTFEDIMRHDDEDDE